GVAAGEWSAAAGLGLHPHVAAAALAEAAAALRTSLPAFVPLLELAAEVRLAPGRRSLARGGAFAEGGSAATPVAEIAVTTSFAEAEVAAAMADPARGRAIPPALPAVHAAPTEPAPPGEAATVPAGTMPAVEIEAVGPSFEDEDSGLLNEVRLVERRLQSAGTHGHCEAAGRG